MSFSATVETEDGSREMRVVSVTWSVKTTRRVKVCSPVMPAERFYVNVYLTERKNSKDCIRK